VWSISVTDKTEPSCPESSISYDIGYWYEGTCDASETYVEPTSFTIGRGESAADVFRAHVKREFLHCMLHVSVRHEGRPVGWGKYTVEPKCE